MKFVALAMTIALTFTGAVAAAGVAAPVAPRAEPVGDELEKRACTASACRCNGISGTFCGNQAINPACTNGHVFQCNPSGQTCDFGRRLSCVQCGKLSCP